MNKCANPDCDAWIPDGAFACTPHWEMCGADIREAVATTDDEGRQMVREAIIEYWRTT